MDRRDALALAGAAAIVVLGGWLRALALRASYSPDELGTIFYGTFHQLITDPEVGINPPLIRMLNLPLGEQGALTVGRGISWVCGTAAVGFAYLLGREASGGSRWAGLLAALMVAVNPEAVKMSARYRAYGPWMGVASAHLWAVMWWVKAEGRGKVWAGAVVAGTAVVLPWLSYLAIPILCLAIVFAFAGLRDTRLALTQATASLSFATVMPLLAANAESRTLSAASWRETGSMLFSLQFLAPDLWPQPDASAVSVRDSGYAIAATMLLVVLCVSVLCAKGLRQPARVSLAYAVGSIIAVTVASLVQRERTPVAVLLLVLVVPSLFVTVDLGPRRWLSALAAIVCLVLVPRSGARAVDSTRSDPYAMVPRFATEWHRYDAARSGSEIYIAPRHAFSSLYFYFFGGSLARVRYPADPPCDAPGCWKYDDVVFREFEAIDKAHLPALVVWFRDAPTDLPAPCELLPSSDNIVVARCGLMSSVDWLLFNSAEVPP
ncbi:MAG: hypothetical protein H6733_10515 [Alphaproteobacteria bacterium]|nr:hypothetical protein [Alphaproteobacteria bacterium]